MKQTATTQVKKRRTDYIHVQSLMERIILQSIEDLWVSQEKDQCIDFFQGEGFAVCAHLAGLKAYDKARLVDLISKIFNFQAANGKRRKNTEKGKKTLTSETLGLWNMKLSTTARQRKSLQVCSK